MRRLLLIILLFASSCNFEGEINLGSGYFLLGDEGNTAICKKITNYDAYSSVILGEILDYDYDSESIIILRKASEAAKVYFNTQEDLWNKQKGADSIQYWIIIKDKDIIKGPLTGKEFLSEKRKLNLSADLKLESNRFY
ncbi:hypothetical protein [Pedobacter frigoris]|uniref:hypothetical protein n=1 Tax=Pedobacter frigoris TaxID=2571272 RepID=UPI00292F3A37|nr:hypothetical protein [Pedobacter frigoris]